MSLRRRVLPDDKLRELSDLQGPELRAKMDELKELRKKTGYGDKYRQSMMSLQLAPADKIDEGLAKGVIPFIDPETGREERFALLTERGVLVMPFKISEKEEQYYTVRYDAKGRRLTVQDSQEYPCGFVFCRGGDMGHILLYGDVDKRGLSLALVKIARDHAMARYNYARVDEISPQNRDRFTELFERAGYTYVDPGWGGLHIMEYKGIANPQNNLKEYYRLIGLDPATNERTSIYRPRPGDDSHLMKTRNLGWLG